jgi:hypothetical protein
VQGGKAAIDLSHFIGAVYGMENMMGRPGGPVSAPLRPLHGTPWTIVLRVLWVLDKTPERLRVLWVLDKTPRSSGYSGYYYDYGYGGRRCARF